MEHEITLETNSEVLAHSKVRKENGEKKLINFKTFTGKLMLNFFSSTRSNSGFLLLLSRIKGVEQKS